MPVITTLHLKYTTLYTEKRLTMCPKVFIPSRIFNISDSLMLLKVQQLHKHELYIRFYPAILSNKKHYIICYSEKDNEFKYKRVKFNPSLLTEYVYHLDTTEDTLRNIIDLMSNTVKKRITKHEIKQEEINYYFYTQNPLCKERDVTKVFY